MLTADEARHLTSTHEPDKEIGQIILQIRIDAQRGRTQTYYHGTSEEQKKQLLSLGYKIIDTHWKNTPGTIINWE